MLIRSVHFGLDRTATRFAAVLLLLMLVQPAWAQPRLFLPVFSQPVPAPIERDLRVVSAASGESLGRFLAGRNVRATAMDEARSRLFMTMFGDPAQLAVFDIRSGALQMVDLPGKWPGTIGLDEPNSRIFVAIEERIAEIDLRSLQVTNVIESGGVAGIAVDSKRGRLHLIRLNALETIDPADATVIQRIEFPPSSAYRDVQRFDPLRDRLYFSSGFLNLEVFDVTEDGLVPHASIEFDQSIISMFLDAPDGRLYMGGRGSGMFGARSYAVDLDTIPPGNSAWSDIDTQVLSLPRPAPYMDLDRQEGILYLVEDYNVTPHMPPRPPGDPMSIFAVDPETFEILHTVDTGIGGPNVPANGFLTRVAGPSGVMAASVPALTGSGLFLLLALLGTIGLASIRTRQ